MSNGTNPGKDPVEAAMNGPDDEIIYDGSHRMRFPFEDLTKSLSIRRHHLKRFIAMIENDPDLVKELVEVTKLAEREAKQGLIEASGPLGDRIESTYMKLQEFSYKSDEVEPDNFLFCMKNIAVAFVLRKYTGDCQRL